MSRFVYSFLSLRFPQISIAHPSPFFQAENKLTAQSSPEEAFLSLIKQKGPVTEADLEKIYNALQPVKTSFLLGDWIGGGLDTGHPGYKALIDLRWAGKRFRAVDDVDPIMVWDAEGQRVWNEDWGHASVGCTLLI